MSIPEGQPRPRGFLGQRKQSRTGAENMRRNQMQAPAHPAGEAAESVAAQGGSGKATGRLLTGTDWLWAISIYALTSLLRFFALWLLSRPQDAVASLLGKWDAQHFIAIAKYGYFSSDGAGPPDPAIYEQRLAFFPGLPGLMRLLHEITGMNVIVAGWLVVAVSAVAAVAGAMALVALMGYGKRAQVLTGIVVATAPMTVTFNMIYTEAPFMAVTTWALIAMIQRKWWLAGLLIFTAGLLRLTAIDIVATFAVVVALYARRNWWAWLAVAVSGVSVISYVVIASGYTRAIGGYFGMQQKGWDSSFDFGVATLQWVRRTWSAWNEPGYVLSTIVIIASICGVIIGFRRLPWPVWLFSAALVANILLSDGIMHSRPRLLLPAIFLILPIVLWLESRDNDRACRRPYVWLVPLVVWVAWGTWFSAYMLGVFEWAI